MLTTKLADRRLDIRPSKASMTFSWQAWQLYLSQNKKPGIMPGLRVDEAKLPGTENYGQFVILGPQHTPRSQRRPKSVAIPLSTDPTAEPDIAGDYLRYGEIEEIDGVMTIVRPRRKVLTRSFRTGGLYLGGGLQQFRQLIRRKNLEPHQLVHCAYALEQGTAIQVSEGESEETTAVAELKYDLSEGSLFRGLNVPFIRERMFEYPEIGNREIGAAVLEGNFGLLLLHMQIGDQIQTFDVTGDPELERKYRLNVELDAEDARETAKSERGNKEGLEPLPRSAPIKPPPGDDEAR